MQSQPKFNLQGFMLDVAQISLVALSAHYTSTSISPRMPLMRNYENHRLFQAFRALDECAPHSTPSIFRRSIPTCSTHTSKVFPPNITHQYIPTVSDSSYSCISPDSPTNTSQHLSAATCRNWNSLETSTLTFDYYSTHLRLPIINTPTKNEKEIEEDEEEAPAPTPDSHSHYDPSFGWNETYAAYVRNEMVKSDLMATSTFRVAMKTAESKVYLPNEERRVAMILPPSAFQRASRFNLSPVPNATSPTHHFGEIKFFDIHM